MNELKQKRSAIKKSITCIETYICKQQTAAEKDETQITIRLQKLEEKFKEFEDVQLKIECLTDEDSLVAEESQRLEMENKYFAVKGECINILQGVQVMNNETKNSENTNLMATLESLSDSQVKLGSILTKLTKTSESSSSTDIKLPTINVPIFTGQYEDWLGFHDLFVSLIHENKGLTNAQKLQFLKSSIKGEASSTLRHLYISDANYQEAWEQLKDKYNKPKLIMDAHMRHIMDSPNVSANATAMRRLINTMTESVRALKALKLPTESWDCWLIYVITNKVDSETRQLWARQTATNENPTFKELIQFLNNREFELQTFQQKRMQSTKFENHSNKQIFNLFVVKCVKCQGNHPLYKCFLFKKLSVKDKISFIENNKLCANCLKNDHSLNKCKSSTCRVCNQNHNTLIHNFTESASQSNKGRSQSSSIGCSTATVLTNYQIGSTILPTAVVLVKNGMNQFQLCRVVLDSGAETSLISEACVQRLKLKRSHANLSVNGIGKTTIHTKGLVNLSIKSKYNSQIVTTNAFILQTVCTINHPRHIENRDWGSLSNLQLADNNFCKSGPVDILIGCDLFFEILLEGQVIHKSGIIAQNTIFGFVISGRSSESGIGQARVLHVSVDVDQLLRNFWEIDELRPNTRLLTEEEEQCELEFSKHYRDKDGRYVVSLPFKSNAQKLGESRRAAVILLKIMENKFERDESFRQQYQQFMTEYLQLGHMRKVSNDETTSVATYYIPHHAVIKSSSTTTRLRVVFNASKKTSSGTSLNDILLVGPTVQDDLISILMRFGTNKIAIKADVAKMYRQIRVNKEHTRFQRICWRNSPSDPIDDYELLTVTYGTASAPFLATKTLNQLASDEELTSPSASKILFTSFYVDDLMTGAESIEDATKIIEQINDLMKKGGFELRKWTSNSKEVLNTIPESEREITDILSINELEHNTVKTLGLAWNTKDDHFFFQPILLDEHTPSKRSILSTIAKLFDPMGWLAPCVIRAKLIMQQLWLAGITWDDPLPQKLLEDWKCFYKELISIDQIKIPRWMPFYLEKKEIHVFSDASEKAYAAVAYLKTYNTDQEIYISLIVSKTRVAPIKQISLPRLELCGAHLASKLAIKVQTSLKLENATIHGWTDSNIVLAWLSDHPRRWSTFIGNRTSEILTGIPRQYWHHVASKLNPADCASRGINPSSLASMDLWWQGPEFLKRQLCEEVLQTKVVFETNEEERKNVKAVSLQINELQLRYSSFSRLKRISAWCLRFLTNSKQSSRMLNSTLTAHELKISANIWYRVAQRETFSTEFDCIIKGTLLNKSSKLIGFAPFVDEDDLIRVGGRLSEANITFDQKHPIILPANHHITFMIVREQHLLHLHAGQRLLQSILSTKFVIIGGHRLIKKVVNQCIRCQRFKAQTQHQQMGQLPKVRVTPSRPFENTGVDYAGPISVKSWKGRGSKHYKAYIALFVCLSTKAYHLELVSGLATADFIAAFKRFSSRRGLCKSMYSDNGTAFIGANRHFRELGELLNTKEFQEHVRNFTADKSIEWHFIPPSAPHFGGIWESGVKIIKYHLRRQVGTSLLTFEELTTLLCQIEAVVNSRPIAPIPVSTNEIEVLTPAHFLIGTSLLAVPEESSPGKPITLVKRWEYIQNIHQSFWKQWHTSYLSQLQQRNKWKQPTANLKCNDIVLIKDENLPPAVWPMGKVTEIHPGKDGIVRVVTLKTKSGLIKRAVTKLVLLTPYDDMNHIETDCSKAGGMVTLNEEELHGNPKNKETNCEIEK